MVGLLRGSDPALKDSYVIVSAHYDHIGVRTSGDGDRINNGANDDASGVASVIELASALAVLKEKPKRSVVFIAWFGEEKGLVGSRYYGRHPIFPLEKTVALVNLEHMGRTDDDDGPKIDYATLTGFDFTDLGRSSAALARKPASRSTRTRRTATGFFLAATIRLWPTLGFPLIRFASRSLFPITMRSVITGIR